MDDLISRQAAMSLAKDICVPTKDGSIYRHRCIDPDAIRELPSAQPTYTDEELQKMQELESAEIEKAYQLGYGEGKKDAQPERKTGRWIEAGHDDPCYYKCNQCGRLSDDKHNFCPNCGARMEEEG